MKQVYFCPRPHSRRIVPQDHDALISINEPSNEPVALHINWKPEQLLRLNFHDVDLAKHQELIDGGEYMPLTEDQAQQIVAFVKGLSEGTCLAVSCLAGISRSAAVAKAIAEHYGLPFNQSYSLYNRYVYRLVSNAFQSDSPI